MDTVESHGGRDVVRGRDPPAVGAAKGRPTCNRVAVGGGRGAPARVGVYHVETGEVARGECGAALLQVCEVQLGGCGARVDDERTAIAAAIDQVAREDVEAAYGPVAL